MTIGIAKVVVLQHRLLHYRVPFFEQLRAALKDASVELVLVHGKASPREQLKRDEGELPWAVVVKNHYFTVGNTELIWQPLPREHARADLLVLMQENRILSNYRLLYRRASPHARVAFWGHGRNFQSSVPSGLRERWKRAWIGAVDWWFAYTDLSVDAVQAAGFPPERITCINNTIDMSDFRSALDDITPDEQDAVRNALGVPLDAVIGLYCGSLYADKRLDVLFESADFIKASVASFHMLLVGDGPERERVKELARHRPWVKVLGAKRGRDKALVFGLAHVIMNPGAVGLLVLDAFCAGLPLVTMRGALHGPEVAYIRHDVNGILSTDSSRAYANAVHELLIDESYRRRIASQAKASSERYSLQQMVTQFVDGVQGCLSLSV